MSNPVRKKLQHIQQSLKVPKNQYNSFGKYNYRSCEDILENVKPLLQQENLTLVFGDTVEEMPTSGRTFLQTTVSLLDTESSEILTVKAYAELPMEQKGMTLSQITGSASSYARKYALNGLFAIDDTKDPDSMEQGTPTMEQGTPTKEKANGNSAATKDQLKKELVQILQAKQIPLEQLTAYLQEHYGTNKVNQLNINQIQRLKVVVASW